MKTKATVLLLLLSTLLISFSVKEQDSGYIKADISKLNKDFDKVVIKMWGNELLGDSIQTSDTVYARDGKFEYHFKIKEPKNTEIFLLKDDKKVASLVFINRFKEKNVCGALYLGNENVEINTNRDFTPVEMNVGDTKGYVVNYEGSKGTDMKLTVSSEKITPVFIKANPDNFALLHGLFWIKESRSLKQLQELSSLFSDRLKKSISYSILKNYINKREKFAKEGNSKNFNWVDINNKHYTFEQAKNDKQFLLLVFWASWCGPCRQEIPELKKFYNEYKDKVSMISLSIDESFIKWKNAVEKEKMPWLNLSGLPENPNGIKKEYNITAVPNLILLDKDGKILIGNFNNLPEIIKIIERNK